jgi:hypothetical protein
VVEITHKKKEPNQIRLFSLNCKPASEVFLKTRLR